MEGVERTSKETEKDGEEEEDKTKEAEQLKDLKAWAFTYRHRCVIENCYCPCHYKDGPPQADDSPCNCAVKNEKMMRYSIMANAKTSSHRWVVEVREKLESLHGAAVEEPLSLLTLIAWYKSMEDPPTPFWPLKLEQRPLAWAACAAHSSQLPAPIPKTGNLLPADWSSASTSAARNASEVDSGLGDDHSEEGGEQRATRMRRILNGDGSDWARIAAGLPSDAEIAARNEEALRRIEEGMQGSSLQENNGASQRNRSTTESSRSPPASSSRSRHTVDENVAPAATTDASPRQQGDAMAESELLTAGEQKDLVKLLTAALDHRNPSGPPGEHIARFQMAINNQGGIWFGVLKDYKEKVASLRDQRDLMSRPIHIVNCIVVSRLPLDEIRVRATAVRAITTQQNHLLYPLEVFYYLALADIAWPLEERQLMPGDFVYHPDEINALVGTASPVVPRSSTLSHSEFHKFLMERSKNNCYLIGRSYCRRVADGNEPSYHPHPLPTTMGVYEAFGSPQAVRAAIVGDMQPILEHLRTVKSTINDDMTRERTPLETGHMMRYWRDYLEHKATRGTTRAETSDVPDEPQPPLHLDEEESQESDEN